MKIYCFGYVSVPEEPLLNPENLLPAVEICAFWLRLDPVLLVAVLKTDGIFCKSKLLELLCVFLVFSRLTFFFIPYNLFQDKKK